MPKTGTYISFYFRNNTIHIFQSTIKSLGNPEYVRFRLSDDRRKMVMEPYDKKEITSFKTKKNSDNFPRMQVRGKRFCTLMIREMGWNPELSYRIPGKLFERQNIVLFNLEGAKEISHE